MVTARSDPVARDEFWAVVLADPDLLDVAFAGVVASWQAEPPPPPNPTLVATSQRHPRQARTRRTDDHCAPWCAWMRAVPRPRLARSPPELISVGTVGWH